MKHAVKYGFYLSGVLILLEIIYYFVHPISMFTFVGKSFVLEVILMVTFMFLAIKKNRYIYEDSGTFFKVAFVTLAIGFLTTQLFENVFSYALAEELNPIYQEAIKSDQQRASDFFGRDPLETLESVELVDDTLEEDITLFNFLMSNVVGLLFIGIPFSILVNFVSRKILKIRNIKTQT